MEFSRSSLLADLKKALPGIDNGNSPIQGSDAFLFSGNFIHTFNTHIGMSIPTATDGMSFALKASEFYKLLTKAGADQVNMEIADGNVVCKMGRFRSKMSAINSAISTYVDALGVSDLVFEELPQGFCDALRLCRVPDSQLGGIFIRGKDMIATDGCVSTMYTLPDAMPEVWIRTNHIKAMLKIGDPVGYYIGPSWAHFRYADGAVLSCSTLATDRYPATKLLERLNMCVWDESCVKGKLPPDLDNAIGRVAIFADSRNGVTPINMELNSENLILSSNKSDGECEESVPWSDPWAGEKITCTLDAGVLLECYRKGVEFYIKQVGKSRALVFLSDNFMQATEI